MYSKDAVLDTFRQEEYQTYIISQIKKHHSIYKTPIDGIYFEELINNGLEHFGIETDWNPLDKSHKQGVDVCGYSLKTCRLKSKKFSITSFRTTSQKTLDDKLKYIEEIGKEIDGYVVCVKEFCKKTNDLKYLIYQFDHGIDFLNVGKYVWETTNSGYTGKFENYVAKITYSMSHQLIFSNLELDKIKQNKKCHLICGFSTNIGESKCEL